MLRGGSGNGEESERHKPLRGIGIALVQTPQRNPKMLDTITYEVYSSRLKKFKAFVKSQYGLAIISQVKDGGYVKVTVRNKYSYDLWLPLSNFFHDEIKI
jgi:hypothetical protein